MCMVHRRVGLVHRRVGAQKGWCTEGLVHRRVGRARAPVCPNLATPLCRRVHGTMIGSMFTQEFTLHECHCCVLIMVRSVSLNHNILMRDDWFWSMLLLPAQCTV